MPVRNILLLLIFNFKFVSCYPQKDSLFVTRRSCTFLNNRYKGFKLVLNHNLGSASFSSSLYDYDLQHFINLDDSSKLVLIRQLLAFKNDSSLCCLDVISHSFNGIEGCNGYADSKRYSVQIDALYIINRLCWPKSIELYSCSNVLYDTLEKKEINFDFRKISSFFSEYENWYFDCKKTLKIGKDFPFNRGRYVWLGGRKNIN